MAERKKQKREHKSESFVDHDLVDDILLRLPTKSLLRFKCFSKAWLALITSSGFRKKHMIAINNASDTSNDGHRIIVSSNHCVQSINLGAGVAKRATTLEFPLEQSQEVASEFEVVVSCNGLLRLVSQNGCSVLLWNPCTREYKTFLLGRPRKNQILPDWFAFGYDPYSDDYKVLRIWYQLIEGPVDIWSLRTETWKRSQSPPLLLDPSKLKGGTHLDGVLYWIGYDRIVGFDLKGDKCELVELPNRHMNVVQLGTFQGRLSLVSTEERNNALWVLTKNDDEQKWSMLMRIPTENLFNLGFGTRVWYPTFLAMSGQVLMSRQSKYADDCIGF